MPLKIRKLKSMLRKAGFQRRAGKGSHTVWNHPRWPDKNVVLSGPDGDDAKNYQVKQVRDAIREVEE
jgi:predicted RNA binding protein YcfA (HicA-like mRNA interferase family)